MAEGGRVTVCVRPEHLQLVTDDSGFAGVVGMALPLGATVLVAPLRQAAADASSVLDQMLCADPSATVNAERANPPLDVMLHDPGPALVAIGQDIVEACPVEQRPYCEDLIAEAQEPLG